MNSTNKNMPVGRLVANLAIGTALLIICSVIAIPSVIPFTLQSFAIFFLILTLGEKKATFCMLCHVFMGLIGLPVFANFNSGIAAIIGPSGGFIIGLFLIPLCYFILSRICKWGGKARIIYLAVGLFFTYLFAAFYYYVLFLNHTGFAGIITSLMQCVVPFILPDILKLLLSYFLFERVSTFIS